MMRIHRLCPCSKCCRKNKTHDVGQFDTHFFTYIAIRPKTSSSFGKGYVM